MKRSIYRRLLFEAFGFETVVGRRVACCHCHKSIVFEEMTIEHLRPIALGGQKESPSNIAPSCAPCNNRRPCVDIREFVTLPPGAQLLYAQLVDDARKVEREKRKERKKIRVASSKAARRGMKKYNTGALTVPIFRDLHVEPPLRATGSA